MNNCVEAASYTFSFVPLRRALPDNHQITRRLSAHRLYTNKLDCNRWDTVSDIVQAWQPQGTRLHCRIHLPQLTAPYSVCIRMSSTAHSMAEWKYLQVRIIRQRCRRPGRVIGARNRNGANQYVEFRATTAFFNLVQAHMSLLLQVSPRKLIESKGTRGEPKNRTRRLSSHPLVGRLIWLTVGVSNALSTKSKDSASVGRPCSQ